MSVVAAPPVTPVEPARPAAPVAAAPASAAALAAPPCRRGQRVRLTGPDGDRFVVRVEEMATTSEPGVFSLVASISTPRRHRGHLITAAVTVEGDQLIA